MNSIKNFWSFYYNTVFSNCTDSNTDPTSSEYWENKLFASSIKLAERENNVKIKIHDNGIDLPDKLDSEETSLGMRLIDVLALQMNANFKYVKSPEGDTVFEIEFEKSLAKGIGSAYLS